MIVKTYALFSGGNDSLVSTYEAMEHLNAQEVLHINTGIGVQETREFVRETCRQMGWPLREEHPPALTYREMVLKYGFPGPGGHRFAYSWLKERAVRKVIRESKQLRTDNIALITGVRRQESARRMGYVRSEIKIGAQIWSAPLFAFSKLQILDYIKEHGLKTNPVVAHLGMSGECLCGAFAQPNEIVKIEKSFPALAQQIHELEAEVKRAGKHCVWGTRPPKEKSLDQYEIPFMPLCSGCPIR